MTLHSLGPAILGVPKTATELTQNGTYWQANIGMWSEIECSTHYIVGKTSIIQPDQVFWDPDGDRVYVIVNNTLVKGDKGAMTAEQDIRAYNTLEAAGFYEDAEDDYEDEEEEEDF